MITNSSINFQRVDQAGLEQVRKLHDQHSLDVDHDNQEIFSVDTELNYHERVFNLSELLEKEFGPDIERKNEKLKHQFARGKISSTRYYERSLTVDKWLNHTGKTPKKAFTLGVAYVGDTEQTRDKLDALGFDYEVKKMRGKDGKLHEHFYLTDKKQRQQWRKIWIDTFKDYVQKINARDTGIKVFDFTIHLDEASPHCHLKILNCGHTSSGHSSYSLNQSLSDFNDTMGRSRKYAKKTTKTPSNRISGRATLADTREILDGIGFRSFQKALRENGFSLDMTFEHKKEKATRLNGMTLSEYKSFKSAMNAVNQKSEEAKTSLINSIELFSPGHKVQKELLNSDEQPSPVSSATGREQHERQSLSYLVNVILQLLKELEKEILYATKKQLNFLQRKMEGELEK